MSDAAPRIELYVRSLAPKTARDEQDRVVRRSRALDADDRIANLDVAVCGDCVCPDAATAETDTGRRILSRYEAFRDWADAHDRELVGFEELDTRSQLTDTRVTGIVFPRITLAEYRNGSLAFVAPSRTTRTTTSVLDRLETY